VEKGGLNIWAASVIFEKRKFAQSGHPGQIRQCYIGNKLAASEREQILVIQTISEYGSITSGEILAQFFKQKRT
jgi:hypothetical protein